MFFKKRQIKFLHHTMFGLFLLFDMIDDLAIAIITFNFFWSNTKWWRRPQIGLKF